jgi:hypothetical protein
MLPKPWLEQYRVKQDTKSRTSPLGYDYSPDPLLLRQGRGIELVNFLLNARAGNKAEFVPSGTYKHVLGITHLEANEHLVRKPTDYRQGSTYSVETSSWLMRQALTCYLDLGGYPSRVPEADKIDILAAVRELAGEFHFHVPATHAIDLDERGTAWIRPCPPQAVQREGGTGPGLSIGTFLVTEIDGDPRSYVFLDSGTHRPDVAVSSEVFMALTGNVDLVTPDPVSSQVAP